MKTTVEEVLKLPRSLQKQEIAKLELAKLQDFIKELKSIADRNKYKYDATLLETANKLKSKPHFIKFIHSVLSQFPEVPDTRLSLDREFEDQKDRLDAIIDDLNNNRIPLRRFNELLHANWFEAEYGVTDSRTFLAYAFLKLKEPRKFLEMLEERIGQNELKSYMETPNFLQDGNTLKKLTLFDLYMNDYGYFNQEGRKGLAEKPLHKEILTQQLKKISGETPVVQNNINNIDTHNIASHKSGDESHVSAFKMMLESNKHLNVKANYKAPRKNTDPSREVYITNKGDLDKFVQEKLKELQKEISAAASMNDVEIFNKYVRYTDIEKFKTVSYADLSTQDKESFEKKIKGFRFKANAAKRYMDEMVNNHMCGNGTHYPYATNVAVTCGLTMEMMVATAYWASQDKANYRSAEVTEVGNFIALVDQLYDMRRGYDIDHGLDKPDEFKFPQNPGKDNNRCTGGGVNSLSWALASTHRAYNPKKINRADIERELHNVYEEIATNNIERIKKEATPKELSIWREQGKVTGKLKKTLKSIFEDEYSTNFTDYYKGYIPDDTFNSVLEQGLDNVKTPRELRKLGGIEEMDAQGIYGAIASGRLPLLHLDKVEGYESTLNYLARVKGDDAIIEEILGIAITSDLKNPEARNVLSFLSKSNLAEEYQKNEVLKVGNKSITLGDIASCSEQELEVLFTTKADKLLEKCVNEYHNLAELFTLYALKIGFTREDFFTRRYGYASLLHFAADTGNKAVVAEILKHPEGREALNIRDKDNDTPLHMAALYGHTEIVAKMLEYSEGRETLKIQNKDGFTSLYFAVFHGNAKLVADILKHQEGREALNIQDKGGFTPLHMAVMRKNKEVFAEILKHPEGREALNIQDKDSNTPLHLAARNGDTEMVAMMLEHKEGIAALNIQNKDNKSPLYLAIKHGKTQIVVEILKHPEGREALNIRDKDNDTLLHLAARNGDTEMVAMMLEHKEGIAALNIQNKDGYLPLHVAALSEHTGIVAKMLEYSEGRETLKIQNKDGNTPLHWAIREEKTEIIAEILKHPEGRETLKIQNKDGNTPLHLAIKQGKTEIVAQILKHPEGREALNIRDKYGDTPLHWAIKTGKTEIIAEILKHPEGRKTLAIKNNDHNTPLHVAMEGSTIVAENIVAQILKHQEGKEALKMPGRYCYTPLDLCIIHQQRWIIGVILDQYPEASKITDKDNGTLLHWAARYDANIVEKILKTEKESENLKVKDNQGKTPFQIAVSSGNNKAVKLFLERGASPSLLDLLNNRCNISTKLKLSHAYLKTTTTALCSCVSAVGTFKIGKLPNYMAERTKDVIHHNRNDHNR